MHNGFFLLEAGQVLLIFELLFYNIVILHGLMASSADPDQMLYSAVFDWGLHSWSVSLVDLRHKRHVM